MRVGSGIRVEGWLALVCLATVAWVAGCLDPGPHWERMPGGGLDDDDLSDDDAADDDAGDDDGWDGDPGWGDLEDPSTGVEGPCADIRAEEHHCVSLRYGEPTSQVTFVGLHSGDLCTATTTELSGTFDAHSIGWAGDDLYGCADSKLYRLSMLDGSFEWAYVSCDAVSVYRGWLVVMPDELEDEMVLYRDFAHAQDDDGFRFEMDIRHSRMTATDDALYLAWHATDEIDRFEMPGASPEGTVGLSGYDTWILGMSVTRDDLLVLNATWPEDRIAVFDVTSGEQLWDVYMNSGLTVLNGLACVHVPGE